MNKYDLVLTPRGVRFGGFVFPCSIGRGGVRQDKREGDGATPVGIHHLVEMYYRADRIERPVTWAQPIGPRDLWSDASDEPEYNQPVKAPYIPSHERMRRADPLYDLVIVTDWNYPDATPEAGSCIFVHQWRRSGYPTEGCIAFRRDHLYMIARMVQPGTRLIVPAFPN